MAIIAKPNIELDDLVGEILTTVIYPPEPAEEQPVNNTRQIMENGEGETHQTQSGCGQMEKRL